MTKAGPRWTGKLAFVESKLYDPIHWKKPCRIFVNSMSDLFHEKVPVDWIQAVFDVIHKAPQHIYQILTKRAERMAKTMRHVRTPMNLKWKDTLLPNVCLGVSVETQLYADERIPFLENTPAGIRFLSVEPFLEPIHIRRFLRNRQIHWVIVGAESGPHARPMDLNWVRSLRDQCCENRVAFFFKQAVENGRIISLPLLDGKRWCEFPPIIEETKRS